MNHWMWMLVGLATLAYGAAPSAVQGQEANKVSEFMRAKLLHSQKVLEGLVREDYDAIAKHAQEMSLLSQASNWQVFETPEYVRQSSEFQRAADELTKAGKEKNLDGAALAYVAMTMKCVACHKYVRGVRMANKRIELPRKR